MAFNINLQIPDDSQGARVILALAAEQHITADEAAQIVFNKGLKVHSGDSPAHRMIGLFSSPEDLAVMESVDQLVAESRESHTSRELGL